MNPCEQGDAQLAILVWELEQMYLDSPRSLTPTWVHPEIGEQFIILSHVFCKEALFDAKCLTIGEKDVFMGVLCKRFSDGKIFFALRGTENIIEWIDDADTEEEYLGVNVIVEKGFYALSKTIGMTPYNHIFTSDKVTYVGHSLGGALAVLLAYKAGASVITFGCPRVGNKEWCIWAGYRIKKESRMYAYTNDLVPLLPQQPYVPLSFYEVKLCAPVNPTKGAPEAPGAIGNHSCLTYAWLIDNNIPIPQDVPSKWTRFVNWITSIFMQ